MEAGTSGIRRIVRSLRAAHAIAVAAMNNDSVIRADDTELTAGIVDFANRVENSTGPQDPGDSWFSYAVYADASNKYRGGTAYQDLWCMALDAAGYFMSELSELYGDTWDLSGSYSRYQANNLFYKAMLSANSIGLDLEQELAPVLNVDHEHWSQFREMVITKHYDLWHAAACTRVADSDRRLFDTLVSDGVDPEDALELAKLINTA